MIDSAATWLIIAGILILIDISFGWSLYVYRLRSELQSDLGLEQRRALIGALSAKKDDRPTALDPATYLALKRTFRFDSEQEQRIESRMPLDKLQRKLIRALNSPKPTKRAEAVFTLGRLGTTQARLALERHLLTEEQFTLKLYTASALSDIGHSDSLPVLIHSLKNASRFYRTRVNMFIADFGQAFHDLFPKLKSSRKEEIRELMVDFASVYDSGEMLQYLIEVLEPYMAGEQDPEDGIGKPSVCPGCEVPEPAGRIGPARARRELMNKACDILRTRYPKVMSSDRYLASGDVDIRRAAVLSLAGFQRRDNLEKLLSLVGDESVRESTFSALSRMTERNPYLLDPIVERFLTEEDPNTKQTLAEVLALRVEYFISRLAGGKREETEHVLEQIILAGRVSEVIDFMNRNRNEELEAALLAIVKRCVGKKPELRTLFRTYFFPRLQALCDQEAPVPKKETGKLPKDRAYLAVLVGLLVFSVLLVPVIFALTHLDILSELTLMPAIKLYVKDFNRYFAFYALAVNFIYFILMGLSFVYVRAQKRAWQIKDRTFLFKPKVLPSVTIVAPAYNEAKTIIESVNSLMNLSYPDYELVIVNDGSSDLTLDTLRREFDLKRVDRTYRQDLTTKEVKGIYVNRNLPKLVVVDKVNGGKADALNTGINVAAKEYICSIDADSLLEEDALLKLVSRILEEDVETPALGGNVLPINGCTVEQGAVREKRIPRNRLAVLQTIEYIRAFMCGRLGWAFTNNLLIISGAFGLFRKERGVRVGGYMTSSGKYRKDTVGEDMEIVVRICRQMREMRRPYRIRYAFNANCWTEVPEDLGSLQKQRFRWQRGLIEILYFHKVMLFNPRYGRIGMIAMPYYFLFEVLGPLFELQGYLTVLLAAVLGVLYFDIAVMLFVAVVLSGTLISIAALLVAEHAGRLFPPRDTGRLLLWAVLENFGIRQYFSLLRAAGYLRMFKGVTAWEKAERKGFADRDAKRQDGAI